MLLTPVEIGLLAILATVLIVPFIVKRVQRNLEAFLFIMGLCAVGISSSWHIGLVEEVIKEPIIAGILLSVLIGGAVLRHRSPRLECANDPQLNGVPLKLIFFAIVIALGLSASVIAPIIPFFLLIEVANLLPIKQKARANLTILASLSIALGAGLTSMTGPLSTIGLTKISGSLYSTTLLSLSDLMGPYMALWILILGIVSLFFTGDGTVLIETTSLKGMSPLRCILSQGTRVGLFVTSLMLVGLAFGGNI